MEHTAVAGQPYTVPCNTTVNDDVRWFFKSAQGLWTVYEFGYVRDAFISRFNLNTSVRGLDISNVQLNDTGNYTCIDKNGQGDHHIHHLTVYRKWHALQSYICSISEYVPFLTFPTAKAVCWYYAKVRVKVLRHASVTHH